MECQRLSNQETRQDMREVTKRGMDMYELVLTHSIVQNIVLKYGGFLKWEYPQIIHLNGFFLLNYRPSFFGYPHLWKPPYGQVMPSAGGGTTSCPEIQ